MIKVVASSDTLRELTQFIETLSYDRYRILQKKIEDKHYKAVIWLKSKK